MSPPLAHHYNQARVHVLSSSHVCVCVRVCMRANTCVCVWDGVMRRRVAADAGHIVDADDAGESDDDGDGGGDEDEAVLGDDEEEWDRHIALNPQDAVDQERGKERLFEKVRVCVCVFFRDDGIAAASLA